ncbi:probable 3-hydroxyisobutyrate dehydrogenase, mitochondrial [Symsagittifera roscoffensis]|uniref:probable 3-hydroxyisobutyrate dehydrogenase, mitochondrial n=1 Tax=Symsagittifera roscoffensis TaxID=84072 RepID=UPI00307C8901
MAQRKTQMENQPAMKVGIIGIGQVGLVLMTNIHKANNTQFILSAVCDTRPEIGQLVPQGVTFTREAAEVVKSCDVIMTCLPRAQDVKTVWERSIKDNLSKGQYWIDHTSSIHSQNEQLDREVTCLGAQFIEAPITGGLTALKRGEMCCLVAGKRTAVYRMKSLLKI